MHRWDPSHNAHGNSDSRSPRMGGGVKTAPGTVLFLILCKPSSSFHPNLSGEGAIFNSRWPHPSLERSFFKPGWGKPVEKMGKEEAVGGSGNLVKLGALFRGLYCESNLDFHLSRELGLNHDLQIRSFTSTPPPGHDSLSSRLCGLGQVKPSILRTCFLHQGKRIIS